MGQGARDASSVNSLVSGGGRKWVAAVGDLAAAHMCSCAHPPTHTYIHTHTLPADAFPLQVNGEPLEFTVRASEVAKNTVAKVTFQNAPKLHRDL